jgi:hypothetical protein
VRQIVAPGRPSAGGAGELEDHSSCDAIAPGATYVQTVTWYLRRLPVGTDRSVGSAALIDAAPQTLGR